MADMPVIVDDDDDDNVWFDCEDGVIEPEPPERTEVRASTQTPPPPPPPTPPPTHTHTHRLLVRHLKKVGVLDLVNF